MNESENYGFKLPSRDSEDIADINEISENFMALDQILKDQEVELEKKIEGSVATEISNNSTNTEFPPASLVFEEVSELDRKIAEEKNENESQKNFISALDKRVTNIEQGIIPSPFETDATTAYRKYVPANALPYAEVEKVGGMTRKCTNLIPLPYASGGIGDVITRDGITWTVNNDGSVSASGTAMRNTSFMLLQSGSFGDKSGYGSSHDRVESLNGFVIKHCDYNSNSGDVYIYVNQGTTVEKTFYPMLNEGSTALPYEPYFDGLRSAPVTEVESVGVNLCGGDAFAESIMSKTNNSVKDETEKTVKFYANEAKNFVLLSTFKENTAYSVFIKGYTYNGNTPSVYSNIRIFYTDGSYTDLQFDEAVYQTPSFKVFITDANKTISQIKGTYSTGATVLYYEECGIFEGVLTSEDFKPYVKNLLPIPTEVQALDGYGEGNPDNSEEYNAIICENGKWKYIHKGDIEDNAWVSLATTEITDISDFLPEDNFIGVEGGGTVTFKNEYEYAVPSEITYQIKGASV